MGKTFTLGNMSRSSLSRCAVAGAALVGMSAACNLGHRHVHHASAPAPLVQPPPVYPMSLYGTPVDPRWSPPAPSASASPSVVASAVPLPPPQPISVGASPPDAPKVSYFSVFASAPSTITDSDLGRPCDEQFRLIRGEVGTPLYAKKEGATGAAGMTARFMEAQSAFDVEANADAWGIGPSIGSGTDRRYILYRAWEQTEILQVNDAAAWLHTPPPDAAWYVASIYLGRSWEVLVSGDAGKFHAGLRLKVEQFGLNLGSTTIDQNISWSATGRGLEAASDSDRGIFAETPDAILAAYHRALPVPIYIEYRNVPGRDVVVPPHLEWAKAPVPDNVQVTPASLACDCIAGAKIAMSCVVHNLSGRAVDATVRAHGVTGTTGAHAEAARRVRLEANQTMDVEINASINGWWGNCSTTAGCGCELVDYFPVVDPAGP